MGHFFIPGHTGTDFKNSIEHHQKRDKKNIHIGQTYNLERFSSEALQARSNIPLWSKMLLSISIFFVVGLILFGTIWPASNAIQINKEAKAQITEKAVLKKENIDSEWKKYVHRAERSENINQKYNFYYQAYEIKPYDKQTRINLTQCLLTLCGEQGILCNDLADQIQFLKNEYQFEI